ncbi:hypothetical protein BCR42DRAFT_440063 [Absidia repens]|uniref:Uncharacterized protein n=1 Tax=Absidia repens TaxID=90262 RepID=A0A1X2I9H8_9FUNG|nr:hypothetical protein BCR42DRAFT_440063 [Absidia repens]
MAVLNEWQKAAIKKANISGLYKLHSNHNNYSYNSGHANSDDHVGVPLGIILGCIFAVILILSFALITYFLIVRRKRKNKEKSAQTKEAGITNDDNASIDETTSSLVVEYVGHHTRSMDDEEQQSYENGSGVESRSMDSDLASPNPSPNQDESDRELLSPGTTSPIGIPSSSSSSLSLPLQSGPQESHSPSSPPHPTITIISPPQPTDSPRESSETARGSFDRPPWNRNSRFQEFF